MISSFTILSLGKSKNNKSFFLNTLNVPFFLDSTSNNVALGSIYLKYTYAEASVAWPHKSISHKGANHLIYKIFFSFLINAVSERLFSAAIFCIKFASSTSLEKITAAGFPEKSLFVNAST